MRSEWREYCIGDIADVVGGSTPSTADPANFDGDIPWLTPKDLSGPHDRYVERGSRNLSRKGLASCSARMLPPNTVLLSSRAPIGYVAIAKNHIATNQGFRNLIVKPGFDPLYIYYWLTANVEQLERYASGSTFKELSGNSLKQIRIRVPGKETQQAIARILGTLDDKIELNRRMNETLEGIARAIFKSWFVDFDPVRAKAAGQQPPGLAPHIADLFPDAFEVSELGEIPRGWEVRPIGDIVKAVGGGTPSTKNPAYWDEGIHCFATPKDLSGLSSPMLLDTERRVTDAGLAKISSGLLPVGTVLLSSRAPVGYLAIAQIPVCVNQGFIAMVCEGPVSSYYVLNWAKANMPEIKRYASGTTFAEISKRNFRPIPALVPSQEVMTAFDTIVESVYAKMRLNLEESRTLAALRDTLLPKLISGALRVPDAERIVGKYA